MIEKTEVSGKEEKGACESGHGPDAQSFFDPGQLSAYSKWIAGLIAEKDLEQKDFKAAMLRKFGEDVEAYLLKLWNMAAILAAGKGLKDKYDHGGEPVLGEPDTWPFY